MIRRISSLLLSVIVSVLAVTVRGNAMSAAAPCHSEEAAYNWYCKNNTDHKAPALPSEFSFIEGCGGYFLDKEAREDDKVIYLTFDAGYENGNVEKILDALKVHNASGAFFILSNLIKRNPELVKRMKDEGSLVCNHTSSHKDMTKLTDEAAFSAELDKLNSEYRELTGSELDRFYRPPEGRFCEANLKTADKLGYKTIFWSFAYADWDNNKQPDKEKAFEKIMSHTHNGMVILLHPTSAVNAEIMDRLLTAWEKDGYRFGSLYELTKTEDKR